MIRYRVEWKEDGVVRQEIFQMHQEFGAKKLFKELRALQEHDKSLNIETKITDITYTLLDTHVNDKTYHTPVRRSTKRENKPTERIKR